MNLWFESHYADKSIQIRRPLNSLQRFRIRLKYPPPAKLNCKVMHLRFSLKTRSRLYNFTKEVTHYPSQKQKSELAEECKLSKVQISTWFANFRRRLKTSNITKYPADSFRKRKLVDDFTPTSERPKKERKLQQKSERLPYTGDQTADHQIDFNSKAQMDLKPSPPPATTTTDNFPLTSGHQCDGHTTVLTLPTPQQQYNNHVNGTPMAASLVYQNERQYMEDSSGVAANGAWNVSHGSLSGSSDAGYWSAQGSVQQTNAVQGIQQTGGQYYAHSGYYEPSDYASLSQTIQGGGDIFEFADDGNQQQTGQCKEQTWSMVEANQSAVKIENCYYNQNRTIAENYALQALLSLKDSQMVYS